jgi:protoporphyrinogen oxidase
MKTQDIRDYGIWFYSPMALPLARDLSPLVVAYDCMDELSAFKNAPRQLLQRESALLKLADVVFTGGPSLYRAKRDRHPSVHCFSSSVDAEHFEVARDPAAEHASQRALPRPRLGYFGVIDERIDLALIDALGAATPHWQICMVGPVVKIDPATLPQRPNIHYFGQQAYEDLPRFAAGWDVCIQPFALNESTQFISPTKTLEYMAAEKHIVSTPITDVVEPYSHVVDIAPDAPSFIAACERALRASPAEINARVQAMRTTLGKTSWDKTAREMSELLEKAVNVRAAPLTMDTLKSTPQSNVQPLNGVSRNVGTLSVESNAQDYTTIIIGAGPTGLSAAYHLGKGNLLLEQNATTGGWCRSIVDKGFTFDYAGHIMFSNDPYVHEMYAKLLGDNVHWQDREAWIYSKDVYTRYPFQGALYGLPPDVLKECIVGAIEARFGKLKDRTAPAPARSSSSSTCVGKAESITDCCGDGIAESTAPLGAATRTQTTHGAEPKNFEEFIYKVWGAGVAKHFAIPYNRKLWAVPLTEMETSWLGGRVPLPDLEEMIEGALRPVAKPQGPNARFGYPLRGGFQALVDGFLPLIEGDVRTNAEVVRVLPKSHKVLLSDGTTYRYERLISTAPLPKLIQMIGNEVPEHVIAAAKRLRHVSVRCVNLGVARTNVTDKHWIYYPEDSVFHRIFVQGNASPHCNPEGGFGLTCEITYAPSKPLPCDGDALIERCIADCIKVGLLREDDVIIARNQVDMPYAYVVYDHVRKRSVETIRDWLSQHDIFLSGRYSEWEYYNSDHAFLAGKKIADAVTASLMGSRTGSLQQAAAEGV